jgi:hypothetical protein
LRELTFQVAMRIEGQGSPSATAGHVAHATARDRRRPGAQGWASCLCLLVMSLD